MKHNIMQKKNARSGFIKHLFVNSIVPRKMTYLVLWLYCHFHGAQCFSSNHRDYYTQSENV